MATASAADVAYIKVSMRPRTLRGADAGEYYVRWTGGGKTRKSGVVNVSAGARSAPCGGALSLYARARRDAGAIVAASDDPRDSLRSVLALVRADDETVATQAALDVGECIAADGSEMEVSLGGSVTLVVTCAAKTIGEAGGLDFGGLFW